MAISPVSDVLSPAVALKRAFLVSRPTPSWRLTTRPGTNPCGRLQGSTEQLEFGSIGNPVISDCSLLRRTVPMVAPSSGLLNPMTEPFRWRLYRDWTLPGTAGGAQLAAQDSYSIQARGKTLRASPVPASPKKGPAESARRFGLAAGPVRPPRPAPEPQGTGR